ncbi:MAG: hypothetical protein JRJ77_18610, partial [Deltaproteobacteria bacterium]|nr:hypothetical protein [Deltaproteobacteria bacterium]
VMDDLREAGCHLITLGQYLAPSERHHPVVRHVPPDEFAEYKSEALARGFYGAASAPLVRSSYRAEELYRTASNQLSSLWPYSRSRPNKENPKRARLSSSPTQRLFYK